MREILKASEPASFIKWKALETENWKPSYSNLQNPEKSDLHNSLLEEQGRTCCYCGRDINRFDSHIEHFRPQHLYPHLSLVYTNLFASCIRETDPGSPLHCGHEKGDWFEEKLHISPLEKNCDMHFSYTLDGQVIPNTTNAAKMTRVLGLSRASLINRRGGILDGVFDDEFLHSVSLQELRNLAIAFRGVRDTGEYPPFFQVIARYAEQLIADAVNISTVDSA